MKAIAASWKKRHGLSLVELLIGLAITSLVLGTGYLLIQYNQTTYAAIDERVSAQNEFRFILGALEREIGTAAEIRLISDPGNLAQPVPHHFYRYYIHTADGRGSLYKKERNNAAPAINPSQLPGLSMSFRRERSNIITLRLQALEHHFLEKEIYTQNTNHIDGSEGTIIELRPVI